jgi:hypothetical protein
MDGSYLESRLKVREYNRGVWGIGARIMFSALAVVSGYLGLGCDDNGGGGEPPTAALSASPDRGGKPFQPILDASASSSDVWLWEFDIDGDGLVDIVEDSNWPADDGNADGIVHPVYPEPGIYNPSVTVTNLDGLTDQTFTNIEVGYGNNIGEAYDYITGVLEGSSYTVDEVNFQLQDPITGLVTEYTGKKATLGSDTFNVVYAPTQEQRDTYTHRVAEGLAVPEIRFVEDYHSGESIDALLLQ